MLGNLLAVREFKKVWQVFSPSSNPAVLSNSVFLSAAASSDLQAAGTCIFGITSWTVTPLPHAAPAGMEITKSRLKGFRECV